MEIESYIDEYFGGKVVAFIEAFSTSDHPVHLSDVSEWIDEGYKVMIDDVNHHWIVSPIKKLSKIG